MMKRLQTAISWDIRLQAKYGLYVAGFVVTAMWTSLLYFLPAHSLQYAIPLVLFGDLAIVGYLFIGAMMFFEKGQGSIEAVIITPLREREYILSKMISILVYVLGSTLLMVGFLSLLRAFDVNFLMLLLSAVVISLFFTELGFYFTSKFKSFTDFLLPTSMMLIVLSVPLIDFFGFTGQSPVRYVFYLWPTYGQMKLLQAAFGNASLADILYGLVYNALCIIGLFNVSIRVFNTSMIGRKGELK